MMLSFKQFLADLVVEELHPELQSIVTSDTKHAKKQHLLANKIKDLSSRGEKTGIEGSMPKGSSRAYLKHAEPHAMTLDGKPAKMSVGTKVAINGALEKHHNKAKHDGMSLGQLQNESENGDGYVNSHYRVLTHTGHNEYESNKENGIFPPLVEHDHKHEWSKVGHAKNIQSGDFRRLTKTKTHPDGISHKDFSDVLERDHNRNNGRYWDLGKEHEEHIDHVEQHPLLQKFLDHQHNMAGNPYDYRQKKNMGIFEHPDGSEHIVARDHGFDHRTAGVYQEARKAKGGH